MSALTSQEVRRSEALTVELGVIVMVPIPSFLTAAAKGALHKCSRAAMTKRSCYDRLGALKNTHPLS